MYISLIFSNKTKYLISIYLNNKYINKVYADSTQKLVLFSIIIRNSCPNFISVCVIFMTIESLNNKIDSIIEIGINKENYSNIPETFVFPDSSSYSDEPFNNDTSETDITYSDEPCNNDTSETEIGPNNPGDQKPNSGNSQDNNNNDKNSEKKFILIIISISVVSFIIICILVICLIKIYNKKAKDFNKNLIKVSFKGESLGIDN